MATSAPRPREPAAELGARRVNSEDSDMRFVALLAMLAAAAVAGHCYADEAPDTRAYWVYEGGWFARATAMETRCCSPPESSGGK